MEAVRLVELMKMVERGEPLKLTTEPGTKLLPVTRRVKAP
jgi:hypothetical protein